RSVDLLDLAWPRPLLVGLHAALAQLDDPEVLLESEGPGRNGAVGRHHQRAAVEHQLVLAANGVDVGDPRARLRGASPKDVLALVDLAAVEGRAVDVRDQREADVVPPRHAGEPGVLA